MQSRNIATSERHEAPMQRRRRVKKLRRILVGTDFSRSARNAVIRAAMLAAEHSAQLDVVHVAPRSRRGDQRGREEWQEEVNGLLHPYGVTADLKILVGGPATMLATESRRFCADLVVLGCRNRRSLKDALIGTTAERFLRQWTGNTLVARKTPARRYRTILACLSLARESCSVVDSALALSRDANLSVLHTYEALFERKLLSQHAGSKIIKRNRAIARRELALRTTELLQHCALPNDREVKIALRHGHPSAIPTTAMRTGADVIVVGRNTSVINDFFFGSVTKDVLRSACSDVLVARS